MENKSIELNSSQKKLLFFLKISGKVTGKTKLQKMIFLTEKESNLNLGFNFVKYNYGPYSFELSEALEKLKDIGLIKVESDFFGNFNNGFENKQFTYTLTDDGKSVINSFLFTKGVTPIKEVVNKWNSQSLGKVIEYVYSKYM